MNYRNVAQLRPFEACETCPLTKVEIEDRGQLLKHDVRIIIGAFKKIHPGILSQNMYPPTAADEIVDEFDDEELDSLKPQMWQCVRNQQKGACAEQATVTITLKNDLL